MRQADTGSRAAGRKGAMDRDTFAALCEQHRDRLWRIVSSVARDADAEEIAQEAVVRAYCARHTFRSDAPFGAWLCKIAVNVAHDYRKSAWRRLVTLSTGRPTACEEHGCALDGDRVLLQREIRAAVAELPARLRTPLWLHFFEGYSVAEIARLEGAPESTMRSRIQNGLRRLRGSLRHKLGEDWHAMEGGTTEVKRCAL